MLKRNRLLLMSSSVVMLCLALIIGATFALFTEEARITNHLQAGNLTASLVRHSYEYTVLGDDGVMDKVAPDPTDLEMDFSEANSNNFFGFDNSKTLKIVPGCSFKSVFTLENNGTTAFTYDFDFVGTDGKQYSDVLAKQLYAKIVSIADDGSETLIAEGTLYKFLTDEGAVYTNNELLKVDASSATKFCVTVSFTYSDNNNDAENAEVWFDFVVNAYQYTGK